MHQTARMTSAARFALALAEPDAMDDRRDDTQPGRRETDRDRSAFADPRFVLQIIALVVSVAGGVLISYVTTAVRTSTLEVAAANLEKTATELKAQASSLTSTVNNIANDNSAIKSELAARARENQDLKETMRMQEARIISLERGLAREEARSR
jgi:septal ring factor EnvC (AmiA/AmiB activator)